LWVLAIIGAIATVGLVLQEGKVIVEQGFGTWLDDPISGTDFLLVLAIPIGVLWMIVAVVGEWFDQRVQKEEERNAWKRYDDESET